ncbi:MAG: T9SS type A sorting domain-containing protein [Bacteroidota bacterium]
MGGNKVSASYFNDACRTVDWRCNCYTSNWGYQVPRTGNAHAGIYTYWDADYINWPDRNSLQYRWENPFWSSDADSTYREYIGMQLSEPLKKDHLYKVSLYVSTSYEADVALAVHNIGVYFSANKIENAPKPGGMGRLYYKPQIENTKAQVALTDSAAWQLIGGEFVAQGGEQYLVIGNFRSTFETELTERSHRITDEGPVTDNNDACFTFVDDVSVELIADVTGVAEQNPSTKGILILPNPNNGNFIIKSENNLSYIKIVDLSGRLVYEQKTNSQQVELSNINLSKGVYILHTKDSEQKEQISKLFISNE